MRQPPGGRCENVPSTASVPAVGVSRSPLESASYQSFQRSNGRLLYDTTSNPSSRPYAASSGYSRPNPVPGQAASSSTSSVVHGCASTNSALPGPATWLDRSRSMGQASLGARQQSVGTGVVSPGSTTWPYVMCRCSYEW